MISPKLCPKMLLFWLILCCFSEILCTLTNNCDGNIGYDWCLFADFNDSNALDEWDLYGNDIIKTLDGKLKIYRSNNSINNDIYAIKTMNVTNSTININTTFEIYFEYKQSGLNASDNEYGTIQYSCDDSGFYDGYIITATNDSNDFQFSNISFNTSNINCSQWISIKLYANMMSFNKNKAIYFDNILIKRNKQQTQTTTETREPDNMMSILKDKIKLILIIVGIMSGIICGMCVCMIRSCNKVKRQLSKVPKTDVYYVYYDDESVVKTDIQTISTY